MRDPKVNGTKTTDGPNEGPTLRIINSNEQLNDEAIEALAQLLLQLVEDETDEQAAASSGCAKQLK